MTDITVSSNVWSICYKQRRQTVNVCVQHFNLYKLPQSKLTNVNIVGMVRFGSGQNKLAQLLIRCRNSGSQTIRSLNATVTYRQYT